MVIVGVMVVGMVNLFFCFFVVDCYISGGLEMCFIRFFKECVVLDF